MKGSSIIVMGVTACGKSTVGAQLAERLNRKFIDGDDLHPKSNIEKMSQGCPLTDEDRAPWLERIHDAAYSLEQNNEHAVIVCSALKQSYREIIRGDNHNVTFLFLDGHQELILQRMRQRDGHFMKENMISSQFDILERPESEPQTLTINIDGSVCDIVERSVAALLDLQ
ncbi:MULTISPECIES: gluconokinase [Vibrio]|uniref:gluconokinase n=1 Tax=Vibrio TaxID=662 RepID=UPI003D10A735